MSLHNKNFWLLRDAGCHTKGNTGLKNSYKVEHIRAHQWDIPEREFFCNKKQAVESITNGPTCGRENVNVSLGDDTASCQFVSGFSEHLFGNDCIRTFAVAGKTIASAGTGNLNIRRKGIIDQFENNSAIDLATTHAMEDPSCGIGTDDVNQVRNSRNGFSVSMLQPHTSRENNEITLSTSYPSSKNNIAVQPTFQKGNGNAIVLGPTFSKAEDNSIPMGQTLTKGDADLMLMGHHYDRENSGMVSVAQDFNKWNCSFISMEQQYGKENGSFMLTGPVYDKEHDHFVVIGPTHDKGGEMSQGTTFEKRDDVIASAGPTQNKEDASVVPMGIVCDKQNLSILSMGQNYDEGEANTISFGPEACDLSVSLVTGSDWSTRQSPVKASEAPTGNDSMKQNVNQIANAVSASIKTDGAPKSKEQKKGIPTNNFPSNVKSMLSTGIFDGVPVKYVSSGRERSLQGVIKGAGYVCGCADCDHSKALNAYEFERHAGGKTKHPNNHIYFENGKTVYAAVQELKSTPQEMLFEAIQNVTGSPINQKNFRAWKVSYQAATRELERIYGKYDAFKPS